jgi:hypothetical protein
MRVNVYAAEATNRVQIVEKARGGVNYVGCRIFLELPATVPVKNGTALQIAGPYNPTPEEDDSGAVTFWAREGDDLRPLMRQALGLLDKHYKAKDAAKLSPAGPT